MPVHQSAGVLQRGLCDALSHENRLQVMLEPFQQLNDNSAGNLARALAPPQGRAYFHPSQRQNCKLVTRSLTREAEHLLCPWFSDVEFYQRAGVEIVQRQLPMPFTNDSG